MARHVGVVRDAKGLTTALAHIEQLSERPHGPEVQNALTTAKLVAAAALARRESRGGHYRSDYPEPDPGQARARLHDARPGGCRRRGGDAAARAGLVSEAPGALPPLIVEDAVTRALAEDLGRAGDITSAATIPLDARAEARHRRARGRA